ncbi:glycosyltransferase family 1 protein [Xylariomycetidae sp. FL2044]|nr:glycosyltransferase family 1 protein [Xylariomycetidae sp. FL2044]
MSGFALDDKREAAPATPPRGRRTSFSEAPEILLTPGDSHQGALLPELPELGAEQDVPPAYSEHHDQISLHQAGFDAGATLTDDGRIDININQTSSQLADFIAPALRRQLTQSGTARPDIPLPPAYIPPSLGGQPGQKPPPRLNVVIQIVGSRGDVQPFVALGQVLRDTYGHRVRIATHATFQKFVEENGLEFFSIGGDPAELMAFMVKNPGLMPGIDALKSGEITKRRKGIEEIVVGCWRSCIETGDGLGPAPRFDRRDRGDDARESPPPSVPVDTSHKPFVADAIIANPPSFAHIHVAEKLGVPLHLMFTMPWSPTRAFPQPLANIQSSNTDPVTTNYVSYAMVEMMTWQGLGDVINRFRTKILDLEPLSLLWAPAVLTRLRIPHTYCWSPALIPKPGDWGQHIDIAGFYFLNLASSYTPHPELSTFLAAGPPPVYIGFGSIVVDDPNNLTRMIFDAVAETGVRALVSKGWGGLGADSVGIPDGVFMLGNVPHDWLFKHVSAVCHHGGAGTTAAGIQAGKPTIVVPFFGDQPFWGAMVARAGAGPDPIPYKKLTAAGLAEAIRVAVKPETQERARELGEKIREEKGTDVGGQSFHSHLDLDSLRCSIAPSRVAVWRVRRTKTHLSALAAATLVNNGYLQYSDLKLFRAKEYSTEDHPTDPISACTSALLGDIGTIAMSAADFPRDIFKAARGPKSKTTDSEVGSSAPGASHQNDSSSTLRSPDTASIATNANSTATRSTSETRISPEAGHLKGASEPAPGTTGLQSPSQRSGATSPGLTIENFERALGAGKSINNIVSTGMKTPMNFCMGLARGFRNAPSLYNDDTIRPTEKVTGFGSGLKVAGKEFGFGLFDGITGLVTQPLSGAEKEGGMGLLKGFGKGIGGLVLKSAAGIWSLPAYAMAGVHAEIRSLFAQSALRYITASRIAQGQDEFGTSSVQERADIMLRWADHKGQLQGFYTWKQKEKGKSREASPARYQAKVGGRPPADREMPKTGWRHTRDLSFDERKKLHEEKKMWKKRRADGRSQYVEEDITTMPGTDSTRDLDDEFEKAIQAAVRETSRGDATEDAHIEQAVRSGVHVLRTRSTTMRSQASTSSNFSNTSDSSHQSDLTARLPRDRKPPPDLEGITDEEYQALIEQAVQLSMAEGQYGGSHMQHPDEPDTFDDEMKRALERSQTDLTTGPEDDEEYKRAIEASQTMQKQGNERPPGRDEDEDEELRRAIAASEADHGKPPGSEDELLRQAIEESEREHKEQIARASTMKSEEEVVLEYVKKQSLAEAAYQKARGKQREGGAPDDAGTADDDEELKRALEESMQSWNETQGRSDAAGPSRSSG